MTAGTGGFASEDPLEVLRAVREAAELNVLTDEDFSRDHVPARRIETPWGVVHPALVEWIAECLKTPLELVSRLLIGEAQLQEGHVIDGAPSSYDLEAVSPSALIPVLEAAKGERVEWLKQQGFEAAELIFRWIPVPPGDSRPDAPVLAGDNPVLATWNAGWRDFARCCRSVDRFIEMDAPALIVAYRLWGVQRSVPSLLHMLRGNGPLFDVVYEGPTDPPTPPELVIAAPGPDVQYFDYELRAPRDCALEGSCALLRYANAIVQVDLETGAFTATPMGNGTLAFMAGGRAYFWDGPNPRLWIYDTSLGRFVIDEGELPVRVLVGACCGATVLDVPSRRMAQVPGPILDSSVDFTVSGCGSYAWLHLTPQADDTGVFSLASLERVLQPWPHPAASGRSGGDDKYDLATRALGRRPDGAFRFLYDGQLCQGRAITAKIEGVGAARFDADASRLLVVDDQRLRVLTLDEAGQVRHESAWSTGAIAAQLGCDLPSEFAKPMMECVGTISALARASPADFEDREGVPEVDALEALITAARSARLPGMLERR